MTYSITDTQQLIDLTLVTVELVVWQPKTIEILPEHDRRQVGFRIDGIIRYIDWPFLQLGSKFNELMLSSESM